MNCAVKLARGAGWDLKRCWMRGKESVYMKLVQGKGRRSALCILGMLWRHKTTLVLTHNKQLVAQRKTHPGCCLGGFIFRAWRK